MLTKPDYRNPFPGLRAFEEHEDVYFFGREKQVDELLRKLRTTRFLAVIGSSGSGKSSLVKSGLIPALHSGFMAGVSSSWNLCSFRPGNNPIGNLAKALSQANILYTIEQEDETTYAAIAESTLRRSSSGLIEVYRQSDAGKGINLLILVDQFEEIFRFSSYEKETKEGKRDSVAFINLLVRAVEQKELPIYIVFTMRSDFLGDCTAFRGLPEKMNDGQYLVPRMTREEKKEAIAGPIAVEGGTITPRLLNLLLNDVGENPDQLPILQHAMMRTWDVSTEKGGAAHAMDIDDYEEAGTLSHALSFHAEEAFSELDTPEKKKACEIMFKALTDREAGARGIRRPRSVAEIARLTHVPVETQMQIINAFRKRGRGFLMPAEEVPLDVDCIIDIAHESLMRGWDRLINWVEEEEQSAKTYLRLCEAADQYELGKAGLWQDPELQIALKWEEDTNPDAEWAARYNHQFYKAKLFLEHSKNQYERVRLHKEEMQKQRLRRAGRVIVVVGFVAIIAFLLAIYALSQKSIADIQTRIANDNEKKAHLNEKKARKSEEYAVQQRASAESNSRLAEAEKKNALASEEDAIKQKNIAQKQKNIAQEEKATADRNRKLAIENRDSAVSSRKIAEAAQQKAESNKKEADKQTQIARQNTQIAERLKNLSDARILANQAIALFNEKRLKESRDTAMQAFVQNADNDGPLQNNDIYNALSRNWDHNSQHFTSLHNYPVRSIVASPAGHSLYSLDESGMLYQFAASDGHLQKVTGIKSTAGARSMALSPDGNSIIVISYDGTCAYISTNGNSLKASGKLTFSGAGKAAAFLNNRECVILTNEGIGKYSIAEGLHTVELIPYPEASALCVGKNGSIVLATGRKIWVYKSWADIKKTPVPDFVCTGQVTALSTDASGRYIAAGTTAGNLCLKDLVSGSFIPLQLHVSSVNKVLFVDSGTNLQLATAGADHTIRIVDIKSVFSKRNEEDILTLAGHSSWVYSLAYTPDGQYLYSAGEDEKIIAWKTTMKGLYNALTLIKN